MKKETKKKVFNFTLATSIVASVVTPLAIVLGKESNLLFLNKNTKQTTSNSQFIGSSTINDTNYTLDLNHALGNIGTNNRTISVGTPNIVKSIPQGYIVVSGNSSNNKNQQVVCLDKNDPTQELWQLDLGGNNNSNDNINIYGVEYTPYDGGRLVVLYSENANDSIYSTTNVQIKFKVFNLKNKEPKLDFAGFGWQYQNHWSSDNQEGDSGSRLDTWGISPIFNLNDEVTKYLIYCKEQHFTNNDSNGRTRFFLIDLKNPETNNDNKCKPIKMRWEKANYNKGQYNGNKKIILSIAPIEKDGQIYIFPLIVDFVEAKLEFGIYKLLDKGNDGLEFLNDKDHIKFNININKDIFDNENNQNNNWLSNKAADLVKGSINSFSFQISENNKLKIVFAINMSPHGTLHSPHRAGKLVIVEIDDTFNTDNQIKQLFQNNQSEDNLNSREELWNGYFANEVIAKHGINVTKTNNFLTPFISIGWNEQKLQKDYPWFVSIIKNPFDSNAKYSFSDINVEDENNFRVYRVNNGDSIDTSKGIYPGRRGDAPSQFGYGQFEVGIPILDYNEEKEKNNVFERNILFTWNKKQEAIIINQKDRESNVNALPTYGYHTRLKKQESTYQELGLISNSFIELTNKKEEISNKIKENLLINNIKNSQITFEKLFFDYEKGQIQFKFKIDKYFNEKGQLKSDNNLEIEGLVTGLQPIKYEMPTFAQNLYDSSYTDYKNRNSSVFIASEIASYNSETNDELYWSLREIVWRLITKNKLNLTLKKQPEFGTTEEETKTNFKSFFTTFSWINSNNKQGQISATFTINKEYLYVDEHASDKTFNLTFSGLRQIKDTQLKDNTKDNAITHSELSKFNIPYQGNSLEQIDYTSEGTKIITEDQLKTLFIEKVFKEGYSKAIEQNGFSTEIDDLLENLPFSQDLKDQNLKNPLNNKLTKEDIELLDYEFFAGAGILSVKVSLNFWNQDGELKRVGTNEIEQNAPSATWYVSGFKKDNVETKFNSETIWELTGIEKLTISDIKKEQNREQVQRSLFEHLKSKKELVNLPYWVNPNVLDSIDSEQIEYELNSIEINGTNTRQATLKVRLKNNMFHSDKETGKITKSEEYQTIQITGFLDPTPIELESQWLKKIKLSGNTKDLKIDEKEEVFNSLTEQQKGFLEIEYSVAGLNQWFKKEQFTEKLKELKGSLDDQNWIIKREDIKARFVVKKEYIDSVFIKVDGNNINNNSNQNNDGISIIDQTNNENVKGYINVDKIINKFKADNFEVRGTDKNPKLIIKNHVELNELFSRYSSDNIFEILYSNKGDENSFDSKNAIWKNGMNLSEINDLSLKVVDGFSLSFKGIENYEVYHNGNLQQNGYVLSSPDIKLFISIEIENPLIGKTIEIKFKDEQNNPIFYQNEGGFNLKVDSKKFDEFLKTSGLEEEKQNAIELAYYVSQNELNEEQLKDIIVDTKLYEEQIEDQKYDNWKTLDTNDENKNLNLLVNDYVVVAIRVKKDFLISEPNTKGYLIKEDSSYSPIQQRVYGYKIKTKDIKINLDNLVLENVGQAESASYALDGYARLKHLSLEEDKDKNYLGASIKINYFNDFYKDNKDQILVSGSGQVLVKRQTGTNSIEYKDEKGNDIVDVKNDNQVIKLELDSDSKPNKLIENSASTRDIILEEYSPGIFRFSSSIISSELQYNFFQNQKIEFEFVNKKGKATKDDEYDYYVDNSKNKIEYTFQNIKFPINNDSNIRYEFDLQFAQDISNSEKLKEFYENSTEPEKEPINGKSKIKKLFSITRKQNNKEDQIFSTLDSINNILEQDFKGQIKLVATHSSVDGKTTTINNGDITTINNLKNGDRFRIEIISSSDDLIFAQQPNPLIFAVQGLYEQPIDQGLLKYLRVKQSGTIDGQGSFNILVDDPNQSNSNSDIKTLLSGYKFLVRVWNENKEIKHDWTENFISINNLKNGDKVEWKLVSPNGSPLVESYYNTVANVDKHNVNENKYSFIQINQEGFAGKNVSEPKEGVGQNPEQSNIYPESSGLVISGLQSEDDSSYTTITFEEFTRVMNLMNFGYSGINGSGNMISSKNALDVKLNVVGRNSETFTLDYLLKNNYISFYYNNDSSSQLNSFNWDQVKDENGNWLTSPGTLSNGDSVRIVYKDPTMSTSYEYYAPIVSGLQNKSDNMSMFSWIGIGLASFVTLGIFAFIYLYVRNRKLK